MQTIKRNYSAIAAAVSSQGDQQQRMQQVVDALWDALHDTGVSWVGFYLDRPDEQDDQRLVLGPRRDKPACSPIGLHGVCGKALLTRSVQIVRDVNELGPNYIACDPRDRAEIVLPLFDSNGCCWGVLDVDSWNVGAFDETDAAGLHQVLCAAGLTI